MKYKFWKLSPAQSRFQHILRSHNAYDDYVASTLALAESNKQVGQYPYVTSSIETMYAFLIAVHEEEPSYLDVLQHYAQQQHQRIFGPYCRASLWILVVNRSVGL